MPTTNEEMQHQLRSRLELLNDKGDWKHEWGKLFFSIRDIVSWGGIIALICLFLLGPVAGIFWLFDQIPGVGSLESSIQMFIAVAVTAPLVGGSFIVVAESHEKRKALIWEYQHDLVKLESIKQRDEIIGLRKKIGITDRRL